VESGGGLDVRRPDAAEALIARLGEAVRRQLRSKGDALAVMTVHMVMVQAIQGGSSGVKTTRLALQLGQAVQLHFCREAIVALAKREARERVQRAASRADAAGDASGEGEADSDGQRLGPPDDAFSQATMRRRINRYANLDMRQTQAMVRRRKEEGGLDEAPEWGSTARGQLGAYLISRLLKHALFQPAEGLGASGGSSCAAGSAVEDASSSSHGCVPVESAPAAGAEASPDALLHQAHLSTASMSAAWPRVSAAVEASRRRHEADRADGAGAPPLEKAFTHVLASTPVRELGGVREGPWHLVGHVRAHERLAHVLTGDLDTLHERVYPEESPMLSPPVAWTKEERELPCGGFMQNAVQFLRTRSPLHQQRLRDVPAEQLAPVFDGLNACSATAWRVNVRVLNFLEAMRERELTGMGILPPRYDRPLPSRAPDGADGWTDGEVQMATREWRRAHKKAQQLNAERHSLRCSFCLKMGVAHSLRNEAFYFAHNLDFRGRVYPVSPHLSYMGDDVCRGLMLFAHARPLGEDGFSWLKVHAANLFGKDKLTVAERIAWADERLEAGLVEALVSDPFGERGRAQLLEADSPVQFYAACAELLDAHQAEDHTAHLSALPVHQDGSCNGLQHYAALGRDHHGGEQVNLVPREQPADVYAGVRALVADKVAAAAAAGDEVALQLDGLVSRKVVKQTVMTSVYGVTFIGARQQIMNRLEELPALKKASDAELYQMANYLAKLTLESLGEAFNGAASSMKWLAAAAHEIAREGGAPVEWVTPLGLPVVQPYHRPLKMPVKTILQTIQLVDETNCERPVAIDKQKSAFAPNYVHSLDSSHMLMTATACRKEGITFAAVHDSYWTHAADVSRMSQLLRRAFIDLHSQPLLEQLEESFRARHDCVRGEGELCAHRSGSGSTSASKGARCPVDGCCRVRWDSYEKLRRPERGHLELEPIMQSTYFFA